MFISSHKTGKDFGAPGEFIHETTGILSVVSELKLWPPSTKHIAESDIYTNEEKIEFTGS